MADDPIQVDDGGSTRIKLHLRSGNVGEMDALLDVAELKVEGKPYTGRQGSTKRINHRGADFGMLRITFTDSAGQAFIVDQPFVQFRIESGDHRVHGEVLTGENKGDLQLTLYSENCPPIVEARQSRGRRRYVIINSPPIDQVFATNKADADPELVYQIPSGPTKLFPDTAGVVTPIFYSSVVIT